jgi:hypothetical protein
MAKSEKIIIPGILSSPLPFRLIKRSEKDNWNPSIEDINKHTYDYVRLHRVSGTIDIGIGKPYTLAVTFDGSFILPAIKKYHEVTVADDEFNSFFGCLLLGGIFTQAVDATYIQKCIVYKNYYFETMFPPINSFVDLKNSFRHKHASVKDNIILYNSNFILLNEVTEAYKIGKEYLDKIKNLSPSFLIKGTTAFINNSFAESLINNWLSIEQILDNIWQMKILKNTPSVSIAGRNDFLKDNRTWTSAAKTEMLFQLNLIDELLYNKISVARKARNYLIHTGENPSKKDAEIAFVSLFSLLSLVVSGFTSTTIFSELLEKYKNLDPIKRNFYDKKKTEFTVEEVDVWLDAPIPPIPGNEKWDEIKYSYDLGFDFEK